MSKVVEAELVGSDTPDFDAIVNINERMAAKCKHTIESLIQQDNASKYDLCLALNEAATNEYGSKFWGMSLEDYADKVLNIGWRNAYYMVSVGRMISMYGTDRITKDDFQRVGWTKLREVSKPIVKALENDNTGLANRLLALTTTETTVTLAEQAKKLVIQEYKGVLQDDTDKEAVPPIRISGGYSGEEGELIRNAIIDKCIALELDPNDKKSVPQALSGIITDWARMQDSVGQLTMEDWIGWFNKKFNVTLVPISPELTPEALLGGYETAVESNLVGDLTEDDLNSLI